MKLSKKILSIVLSVLMVVSSMPFTAVTAFAADIDSLKTAISNYEGMMNGTIYKNMKDAYDAYVDANNAINKACNGDPSELATAKTKLENAIKKMTETPYTAPTFTTVAPKFPGNDIGEGYYGNVIYAGTDITDINGKDGDTLNSYQARSWGDQTYTLYGKMHCNRDIVFVYNGNKDDLKLPVTFEVVQRRSGGTKDAIFKTGRIYSNGGDWTLYQDWFGNSGAWNKWPSDTKARINYEVNGWEDKRLLEVKGQGTTYYYGNCVKYTGDPDTTSYYNHYNKGSELNFTVFSQGNYLDDYNNTVNLSPIRENDTQYGSADIYVLNYEGLRNIVSNAVKNVKVTEYKYGGLSSYLATVDEAAQYGPDKAVTGATSGDAIARAFSTKVTGYKTTFATKPDAVPAPTVNHDGSTVTSWTTTKNPTCTENGSRVGNCQYCGQKVELPIEKTGHNYSGAVNAMYESGKEKTTKDYKHSVACVNDGSHTKEVQCTFVRAIELDVPATETTEGKEYERCSVCGGTRYTVIEKLAPEIKYNVVDRNDATTDTSSKVNVVTEKNEENNTVVKAEIKAEEAAKGTKFIGWYDKTGKLVSSSPEFVVTDPSMELTVKTADRANDGYSLGMNGKVDCHVYIDALYYTDNVDNTTITVRYNKNGTTYAQDFVTVTKTGAEVINNGDEFLFTTGYAPAQISEKVTVTISAPDMEAPKVIEASIESYCAAVIGGDYPTALTNLCQSVINYGSAAQGYFDGVTSPDVTTATTPVENLTTADVEAYKPTIKQTSASKADFQVTDMTFMSLDNSAIRFYYTGSLEGYTVTADGIEITPQSKVVDGETYNYFEVSGIAAADLDVFHDIIIKKDSKIAFYAKASALSYVYLGVNNAPGALQNYKTFLATLVAYNIKNKEYKASQKA